MKQYIVRYSVLTLAFLAIVSPLYFFMTQQPQSAQAARTFTFVNNTANTVWVGASNNPGYDLPDGGGWELAPGASYTISLPPGWAGRFWGRTGCTFDEMGNGYCETGDCGGRLLCGGAWGALPATLAEFKLDGWQGLDFYDISLVDGYNLPVTIATSAGDNHFGCEGATCLPDLNAICPAELQVKNGSGTVVACNSACTAFNTDQFCCRGDYGVPETCIPSEWPVNYAQFFKDAYPNAYSYAYDDPTSTFTCTGCSYTIAFGGGGAGGQNIPPVVAAPEIVAPEETPTIDFRPPAAFYEVPDDCPTGSFAQEVGNSGPTSANVLFRSCDWSAGYVILHYKVSGQGQENVQMGYDDSQGGWTHTIGNVGSGQQVEYSFTYQRDGMQYDTDWSSWSQV